MKALLVVGSPRKGKSTSVTLGTYLLDKLAAQGAETETEYVYSALNSAEKLEALVTAIAQSDLVILAAPLYVDTLPAQVTKLLEILAVRLAQLERPEGQQFLAISNCGFPEAQHNHIALAIYEQFARETGFEWAGGLALGAGEAVRGRPLAQSGGMARNVMAAFDLAAEALVQRQAVPAEAVELMSKLLIPAWLYRVAGSLGWWLQARPNGALGKLRTRVWERQIAK